MFEAILWYSDILLWQHLVHLPPILQGVPSCYCTSVYIFLNLLSVQNVFIDLSHSYFSLYYLGFHCWHWNTVSSILISDDDITSSHGPINILFKLKTLDRIFELIMWIICVTMIVHKSISILSMVSISWLGSPQLHLELLCSRCSHSLLWVASQVLDFLKETVVYIPVRVSMYTPCHIMQHAYLNWQPNWLNRPPTCSEFISSSVNDRSIDLYVIRKQLLVLPETWRGQWMCEES